MPIIDIQSLSKHFKTLNRHEGLVGTFRDLFSKDYSTIKAVDDISMSINKGEIVGYIGPNGAGKSTTIKMMTGVLKPTGGRIVVNGNVPYANRKKNAQFIGVVFGQRSQLWWDLPVIESFKILKEIYRVDTADYDRTIKMFNDLVDLEKLYGKPVRTLSLGQRMLCDIAAAFLHRPKVVFLDEPTIGLDISIKRKIRTVIQELNATEKTTIILTTHDIGDIEALCKRVVIIDKGKIIFDDAMEKVTKLFGAYRTLKVQLNPNGDSGHEQFCETIKRQFAANTTLEMASGENGWVDITINQDDVPLRDVLNYAMTEYKVRDIKIAEIATESVIQKIYDGAGQ